MKWLISLPTKADKRIMLWPSLSVSLLGFLAASALPFTAHVSRRQVVPLQISWATDSKTETILVESTVTSTITEDGSFVQLDGIDTPFLLQPPVSVFETYPVETLTTSIDVDVTATVYDPPVTITLTASPSTITSTITISETTAPTPGSFWAAPNEFSDLSAFKVNHFACGQQNLEIVKSIPQNASDQPLAVALNNKSDVDYTDSPSMLQLMYPVNSINPGNSPVGGADFYATPLPIDTASNVTLSYSVFFPSNFDWVEGGKLPGLYGGHMTCSGGDNATTCFSTRMMWRSGGAGELYLYAPKDKQTAALCNAPPKSVCDAAYGLSIGRGSFSFSPGRWTNIRQTVSLNTPGQQDGGFQLEVNGKLIMDRNDVYYRDIPTSSSTPTSDSSLPLSTQSDGGLLSPLINNPLLGGVLGPIGVNGNVLPFKELNYPDMGRPPLLQNPLPFSSSELQTTDDAACALMYNCTYEMMQTSSAVAPTVTMMQAPSTVTISSYLFNFPAQNTDQVKIIQDSDNPKPIGFSGLFFSTFFGGNSEEYATPIDQYAWFRDFSMTINS